MRLNILRKVTAIVFAVIIGSSDLGTPVFASSQISTLKKLVLLSRTSHSPVRKLKNGGSVTLTSFKDFIIEADVTDESNTSVRFHLTNRKGISITMTDSRAPYQFKKRVKLARGTYWITATPHRIDRGIGSPLQSGTGLTQKIIISDPKGSKRSPQQNVPIPSQSQWEANMISFGRTHCDHLLNSSLGLEERLNATYYDAEWVFYQIAEYTGDSSWRNCAQAAEAIYRDQYVVTNAGVVPGYWNFTHGMAMDYLSTGDSTSKNSTVLLSQYASYAPDWTPLGWTENANMSREVAYAIMAYLNAETVGAPHRARTEQLVTQALGHLNQWTVSRTADYVRPFMFALTAHALISYDSQIGGDTRILPALQTAADWMWDNTWLPQNNAFMYTDRVVASGGKDPAPDLNLLIAPVYAWLWHQTGNSIYRDRADQIFSGGVTGAWLSNGKQYNQNYRWSFDYIRWRTDLPLN